MNRIAILVASMIAMAASNGPSFGQAAAPAPAPKLGTLEEAPDTPAACIALIDKSKAAMTTASLSADQKSIVERAIRWGVLWKTQADAGMGAPGYRRCAISMRPAQVLLKLAI